MILSVPYAYEVVGYEPHRRTPVTDRRRAVVEVLVEEIPAAEAPVALVLRRSGKLEHRAGRNDIPVRRIGDGLWVAEAQAGRSPGTAPPPGPAGEALLATVARAGREGNPFGHFLPSSRAEPRPEKVFRREVSSDRDKVEAEVRARASEVVAVDGVLHVRCPEPVLVRRGRSFEGFLPRIEIWWHDARNYAQVNPGDVYRLDEWPSLLSDARREAAASEMGPAFDLPDALDWYEVRDPGALRLPLEASALGHAVAALHQEMGRVVRRCTEAGTEATRSPGGEGAGRDRLAWSEPYEVDVPDAALLESYVALGLMLRSGLDEAALERVRAMMLARAGDHAGWGEADDHRRWKYSSVTEAWAAVGAAFERWDARPARLRSPDAQADDWDMEALAGLPG